MLRSQLLKTRDKEKSLKVDREEGKCKFRGKVIRMVQNF